MEQEIHADIARVCQQVNAELYKAMHKHGSMKSSHEGYAVILEELDELWDEVKYNPKGNEEIIKGRMERMKNEAIQVAAMAMRFVIDVCGGVDG